MCNRSFCRLHAATHGCTTLRLIAAWLTCLLLGATLAALHGCAETHPDPVTLACDNYVNTLGCNPSPAVQNRAPFLFDLNCVPAFKQLSQPTLECIAASHTCDVSACTHLSR